MEWIRVNEKLPEYNKLVLVAWIDNRCQVRQSVASVSKITRHAGKDSPFDDRWWVDCSRTEINKPIYWAELDEAPK